MAFDFKNLMQSTGIAQGSLNNMDWTSLAAGAINGAGGWSGLADIGVNAAMSFVDRKGGTDTSFDGQQQIGNVLMKSGNPYLMAAGAAYKGLSVLGEATGTNVNTLNKKQARSADINGWQKFGNNALSYIPMAGAFSGDTNEAHMSQETQQYSGAYSGSYDDISTAQSMGGKTYLFGKKKANQFINQSNDRDATIAQLGRLNTYRKQADMADTYDRQNYRRYQGTDFNSTAVGKNGMKLMSKNEIAIILNKSTLSDIPSFQNGGVIGVDTNILPEGALHKNKNNIEDVNPEIGSEVTEKGIPVISVNESGEITQVAEIEKEEIILRKEVTTKLEELWKDGSEEAMIEAGRLLSEEIITNTQDNTGQLENGNDISNNQK